MHAALPHGYTPQTYAGVSLTPVRCAPQGPGDRRHVQAYGRPGTFLARGIRAALLCLAAALSPSQADAADDRIAQATATAQVAQAQLSLQFNPDLLSQLGLRVQGGDTAARGALPLLLSAGEPLRLSLRGAGLQHWDGGELRASGGPLLLTRDNRARFDFRSLRLRPRAGSRDIDLLGDGDAAALYADAVMAVLAPDRLTLRIESLDVRIGAALAQALGQPAWAGLSIASAHGELRLSAPLPPAPSSCAVPRWPGSEGGAYVADLRLDDLSAQMMRCGEPGCSGMACSCDGPGGIDAAVVLAPSAHLSNSADDNNGQPCTAQDPCTADLPWNAKFSAPQPPYGNDQHPLLAWSLYRLDADGGIAQIGRSGVKHAFVALNLDCDCTDPQVLGRGCGDIYAANNNDNNAALGPRSEIAPAQVIWGRCGALEDDEVVPPNADLGGCDSVRDASGNTVWSHRLATRESQLDPAAHPGARYLFEAWYLVRGDVDIANSMGFIEVTPTWDGVWNLPRSAGTTFRRGAVLDQWVVPDTFHPLQRSSGIAGANGHARLAMRVTPLPLGRWRYDYALMNFDYAVSLLGGSAPDQRLLHSQAITALQLPLAAATPVLATAAVDGDLDAANDWPMSRSTDSLRWQTVTGAQLRWGSLLRFSLVSDAAPVPAQALSGDTAAPLLFDSLAPGAPDADRIHADGFDPLLRGDAATAAASPQLFTGR
jgi:hypothetical protein